MFVREDGCYSSIRLNICPATAEALAPGTPCTRTISKSSGRSAGTEATTKPSPGAWGEWVHAAVPVFANPAECRKPRSISHAALVQNCILQQSTGTFVLSPVD